MQQGQQSLLQKLSPQSQPPMQTTRGSSSHIGTGESFLNLSATSYEPLMNNQRSALQSVRSLPAKTVLESETYHNNNNNNSSSSDYITPLDSVMSQVSSFKYYSENSSVSGSVTLGNPATTSVPSSSTVNNGNSYSSVLPPQVRQYEKKTNLEMSTDNVMDVESAEKLPMLLKRYILKKCSLNEWCRKQDFDGTALDGLNRLSFVQALQAVEHYAASVSEKIQKKPAFLMGILRGQESHWDNSRAAAQLEGGSLQLLNLPGRIAFQVGQYCLEGNCLPSDFTPEVLLSLHSLTVKFGMKAIGAFNANKRIVAGCKGGVVNRPRFLQRLIENVIQQNPIIYDSETLEENLLTDSIKSVRFEDIEDDSVEYSQHSETGASRAETPKIEKDLSNESLINKTEEQVNVSNWQSTALNKLQQQQQQQPSFNTLNTDVNASASKATENIERIQSSPPGFENHPMSSGRKVFAEPLMSGLSSTSPKSSRSFFSMLGSNPSPDSGSLNDLLNSASINSQLNTNIASKINKATSDGHTQLLELRVQKLEAELAKKISTDLAAKQEIKMLQSQVVMLQNECQRLKEMLRDVTQNIQDKILFGVQNTFNDLRTNMGRGNNTTGSPGNQ